MGSLKKIPFYRYRGHSWPVFLVSFASVFLSLINTVIKSHILFWVLTAIAFVGLAITIPMLIHWIRCKIMPDLRWSKQYYNKHKITMRDRRNARWQSQGYINFCKLDKNGVVEYSPYFKRYIISLANKKLQEIHQGEIEYEVIRQFITKVSKDKPVIEITSRIYDLFLEKDRQVINRLFEIQESKKARQIVPSKTHQTAS